MLSYCSLMSITVLFSLAILIMSVVIHEVSHGLVALWQGDPTAKYQGRLTLNPIKHIDLVGSIIVPILCAILPGSIMFGWAKPVPINPYNFSNRKFGEAIVAAAGPLSNLAIAVIAGLVLRFGYSTFLSSTIEILTLITLINIVLAIFNLVPVPPLDGSKILFAALPSDMLYIRDAYEKYGVFITIFFIFFIWQYFTPLIFIVFSALTGIAG